ncbi:MAG: LPS export ABC transporter permease LptF [Bdellovibrionota bacterium]
MWKSRRVFFYLLSEMVPTFILGVLVFISILLMFQALRLTEFVLVHGIKFSFILDIMGYMSISFLPMILPMSLLFAVLMTYNRLSLDSEIIALKGAGYHGSTMLAPAAAFALIVSLLAAQTAFYVAPWGNRQFELLITHLGNTKAAASIKEGTFSEGFFDMVIYANKVNSEEGLLQDLFIYDDKNPTSPLTIIAPQGHIIPDLDNPGHSVLLRLFKGQIHRRGQAHTVVEFDSYDILLNDPVKFEERKKSPPSLNYNELQERLKDANLKESDKVGFAVEFHKRFALAAACLIFALVGVGYGVINDRRSGKSSGFVVSVAFIVGYFIIYVAFEGLSRSQKLPPYMGPWLANFIFAIVSAKQIHKKLS